jgi:hypothetical protein
MLEDFSIGQFRFIRLPIIIFSPRLMELAFTGAYELSWLDKTLPNTKTCCTDAFGYISIDGITPSNQDIFL